MNPVGPQTHATPRFEPPAARPAELRPAQAEAAPADKAPAPAEVKAVEHTNKVAIESKNSSAHVAMDAQKMRDSIQEAVDRLNEQMQQSQRSLGFKVDSATDQVVVMVTNKETGEVVRQIPTEAAIRMSQSFEALKGLIYDETL
jgi:flagellar protein FlaG